MNDFFPAIVSVLVPAAVFLFAYVADMRKLSRLQTGERRSTRVGSQKTRKSVTTMPIR